MYINVDVLYLIRNNRSTDVIYTDKNICIPLSFDKIFDEALNETLNNFKGRIEATRTVYKIRNNTPLYLDSNLIFQPLYNNKSWNQIYINICRIKNLSKLDNENTKIVFDNEHSLNVNISITKVNTYIKRCLKIRDDQIKKDRRVNIYGKEKY